MHGPSRCEPQLSFRDSWPREVGVWELISDKNLLASQSFKTKTARVEAVFKAVLSPSESTLSLCHVRSALDAGNLSLHCSTATQLWPCRLAAVHRPEEAMGSDRCVRCDAVEKVKCRHTTSAIRWRKGAVGLSPLFYRKVCRDDLERLDSETL